MSSTNIKRHVFKNGLELTYQKMEKTVPVTAIYVFCKVGSANENSPIRGASHFVEHMCFEGTRVKNVRELSRIYNDLGANINAYTINQHTCYHIKSGDNNFYKSYKIITDLLLDSIFPKKEFIKEQHVIVEENIRAMDDYEELITDIAESIYYRGSSYENPVDSITYHPSPTHLKLNDMIAWYKWFYVPSNMVISIVSQLPYSYIFNIVSHSNIAKQHISNMVKPSFALSTPCLTLLPVHPNDFSIKYHKKTGMSTILIHLGFRTCNHSSIDKYPLQLLQSIMNGPSGKLFTEFRTKHGVTYTTSCETSYQEHSGYFSFFIQTDPRKLMIVLSILINLVNNTKNGILQDDINRAKNVLHGDMLRTMESIDNFALYNGIESMRNTKHIIPIQDLYSQIYSNITKKCVNDVIDKYFNKENMVVCILYDKDINKKKIDSLFETACNRV